MLLSRIPINILGRLGVRFHLFYESPAHPAQKILAPLFNNIKHVRYVQGLPNDDQRVVFKRMISLSARLNTLWRVPLVEDRPASLPKQRENAGRKVLLQTHLDDHHGFEKATAKNWRVENWISLMFQLNKLDYTVSIMEWNAAARSRILSECPFATDISQADLRDLCFAIADYDLVISIDSWVKYPAEWHKKNQVIIVPNLNNGYMPAFDHTTADFVAGWWFHSLMNNPRVKVIGLELVGNKYQYTLDSLEALTVDSLMLEVKGFRPLS